MIHRVLACLALTASVTCAWALDHDQRPDGTVKVQVSRIEAARLLIVENRLVEAKALLEQEAAARPDDRETLFLQGMIAIAEKNYDAAFHDPFCVHQVCGVKHQSGFCGVQMQCKAGIRIGQRRRKHRLAGNL